MEQEFDKILMSVLDGYEASTDGDVNKVIEDKCKEFGLNKEEIALLNETNEYIEDFDKAFSDLQQAKENGMSTRDWFNKQMDAVTEGRTEEEKAQLATAITEALDKSFEEGLKAVEKELENNKKD